MSARTNYENPDIILNKNFYIFTNVVNTTRENKNFSKEPKCDNRTEKQEINITEPDYGDKIPDKYKGWL